MRQTMGYVPYNSKTLGHKKNKLKERESKKENYKNVM